MIPAFPLQWPAGIKRTPPRERVDANFKRERKRLTMAQAIRRLMEQVDLYTRPGRNWRIPPDSVVVNSDLRVRKDDGMPYANARTPEDPGVAIYFQFDGQPRCIPCDKFVRMADNIAGVASALGAIRQIERHANDGLISAVFTGFAALPETVGEHWRQVLQLTEVENVTVDLARSAHKRLSLKNHPDRGGSDDAMARINKARDEAMTDLLRPGT